jgi:hypothetical protein
MSTKTVAYQYYWNSQEDAQGRYIGMMDGFKLGDKLTLAYEGTVSVPSDAGDLEISEKLFEIFNIDRPDDYRGPSMSIGSVVILNNERSCSVAHCGFLPADISKSTLQPQPAKWID